METQINTDIKVVSSLEGVEIIQNRRCGNTTRIINNVIELLFKGHEVALIDVKPVDSGTSVMMSSDRLYNRVKRRIKNEYPLIDGSLVKSTWNTVFTVRLSHEKLNSMKDVWEKHEGVELEPNIGFTEFSKI